MDNAQNTEPELHEAARPTAERIAALPRTLAGMQLILETPRLLMDRDDIITAAEEHNGSNQASVRVLAAALMLCWPSAHKRAGVPRYKGEILRYGGEVYEFLLGHGATIPEVLRAGGVALALCHDAFVAQLAAQEEARGNSTAPGTPASGSKSPSSSGMGLPSVALASSSREPQES